MNLTVFGLWHLGCVTAACTAAAGNRVIGLDLNQAVIEQLRRGKPPIQEPGLAELIGQQLAAGNLSFTADPAAALSRTELLWVALDTPVDEQDQADVEFVRRQIEQIIPSLQASTIVLVSSQVPVGFSRALVAKLREKAAFIAYSPENLRLGKAIEVFNHPERIVIGISDASIKPKLAQLFAPFTSRIEWMSLESAEMTKHAINAFLATSVSFANELARLCEQVGADAKQVERGLKSEGRIGPKAYLSPGVAFSGGTLARDLRFLTLFGKLQAVATPLLDGVLRSNELHQSWTRDKVRELLAGIESPRVAVLGLTYKPGTDTLRRSASVELCRWMHEQGYRVVAHDPAVRKLAHELRSMIDLKERAADALADADLCVIATEWPQFRELRESDFTTQMRRLAVIDPNWFLADVLKESTKVRYLTTGRDSQTAERSSP